MRRLDARGALAILGTGVLLAFGTSDASWATSTHRAHADAMSRSTSINAESARSTQYATEAIRDPELSAVGRTTSESSRPPIGYVAFTAIVAAACAFRRRACGVHIRSVRLLVSRLGSRAPPALSSI
jgi:hypothetical protein